MTKGHSYQSEHLARYQTLIQQLLDEQKAYRCYCSKARLDTLREEQIRNKLKPRYDGYCREHPAESNQQDFIIRFKNPLTGSVSFTDEIHGPISIANQELDDLVIARQDGSPTYNFTVVVDDLDMQISHVIRGDDHINNTPRQINIFHALNAAPPSYAHVPMILGEDGKRLSKRHGAVSVLQYRDDGYLPQALLNYLVRLGWSHGDQEIFSQQDIIQEFSLKTVNKSAARLNSDKLDWLNQHYLKTDDPATIAPILQQHLQGTTPSTDIANGPPLNELVLALRERCKTIQEMAEKSVIFFQK